MVSKSNTHKESLAEDGLFDVIEATMGGAVGPLLSPIGPIIKRQPLKLVAHSPCCDNCEKGKSCKIKTKGPKGAVGSMNSRLEAIDPISRATRQALRDPEDLVARQRALRTKIRSGQLDDHITLADKFARWLPGKITYVLRSEESRYDFAAFEIARRDTKGGSQRVFEVIRVPRHRRGRRPRHNRGDGTVALWVNFRAPSGLGNDKVWGDSNTAVITKGAQWSYDAKDSVVLRFLRKQGKKFPVSFMFPEYGLYNAPDIIAEQKSVPSCKPLTPPDPECSLTKGWSRAMRRKKLKTLTKLVTETRDTRRLSRLVRADPEDVMARTRIDVEKQRLTPQASSNLLQIMEVAIVKFVDDWFMNRWRKGEMSPEVDRVVNRAMMRQSRTIYFSFPVIPMKFTAPYRQTSKVDRHIGLVISFSIPSGQVMPPGLRGRARDKWLEAKVNVVNVMVRDWNLGVLPDKDFSRFLGDFGRYLADIQYKMNFPIYLDYDR